MKDQNSYRFIGPINVHVSLIWAEKLTKIYAIVIISNSGFVLCSVLFVSFVVSIEHSKIIIHIRMRTNTYHSIRLSGYVSIKINNKRILSLIALRISYTSYTLHMCVQYSVFSIQSYKIVSKHFSRDAKMAKLLFALVYFRLYVCQLPQPKLWSDISFIK